MSGRKRKWHDFLISNPYSYQQIEKKIIKVEMDLERFEKGLRKALGISAYSCTDLEELISELNDISFQLESRQYIEEQNKNG